MNQKEYSRIITKWFQEFKSKCDALALVYEETNDGKAPDFGYAEILRNQNKAADSKAPKAEVSGPSVKRKPKARRQYGKGLRVAIKTAIANFENDVFTVRDLRNWFAENRPEFAQGHNISAELAQFEKNGIVKKTKKMIKFDDGRKLIQFKVIEIPKIEEYVISSGDEAEDTQAESNGDNYVPTA